MKRGVKILFYFLVFSLCFSSLPIISGQDTINTYIFNPITDSCVYPDTSLDSSFLGTQITVRTCAGEFIPATFVVRPTYQMNSLVFALTNLTGPATILKENVDIRTVKCWYQRGDQISPPHPNTRVFLPELLLKDDDLVKVTFIDMTHGWNQVKTSNGYITINNESEGSIYDTIIDSPTLLPVKIDANMNKQFWITIHVPENTTEGIYTGTITLFENGISVSAIQLSVEVLPFTLPEDSVVESSFYYTQQYTNGAPTLGQTGRSREQLNAEFKNLKDHGITNPTICQSYYVSESKFATYMQIRQDHEMKLDKIYYVATMHGYTPGDFWPLDKITVDEIQQKASSVIQWFQNNYGVSNVYFYTDDEQNTVPQAAQILSVFSVGGKTLCAQSSAEATDAINYDPPLLDHCILENAPNPTLIKAYQSKGKTISIYGNPQAGEEKPLTYRRNYGLLLWQFDVDVSTDFAYAYGYGNLWNDWGWTGKNIYKQHVMAYPTTNGVVDTIQWEGWREGVNDVRYITKLMQLIESAKKDGNDTSAAEQYLSKLKNTPLNSLHLDTVRNDVINHILILLGYPDAVRNDITGKVLEIPRYTSQPSIFNIIIIGTLFGVVAVGTFIIFRFK